MRPRESRHRGRNRNGGRRQQRAVRAVDGGVLPEADELPEPALRRVAQPFAPLGLARRRSARSERPVVFELPVGMLEACVLGGAGARLPRDLEFSIVLGGDGERARRRLEFPVERSALDLRDGQEDGRREDDQGNDERGQVGQRQPAAQAPRIKHRRRPGRTGSRCRVPSRSARVRPRP